MRSAVKKTYRQYSTKQRALAIALVNSSVGFSERERIKDAAKQTGFPAETIRKWINGTVVKCLPTVQEQAEVERTLDENIDFEIKEIFKEMREARSSATYRDLAYAFGVLADKKQLLNGNSTANIAQQITLIRSGESSIPAHLARLSVATDTGDESL